jgi:ABC-type multidrug transport system ATPase subunit
VSAPALVFRDVSKRYSRRGPLALDALSFEIPRGVIAGFVGPNGAGKTTTFSVVSGYLQPDGGEIDILGQGAFHPHRLKGRLGVLPQDAELPDRHTPIELLAHLGQLQGMTGPDARREAERVLQLVRLGERRTHRIATLSHGMRRRVAVASALCGSPELVLLDEPLAGLDPVQAHGLRDALAALRGIQTLVVSSHNLSELERLCDWVVMLRAGQLLRQGSIAEVTGRGEVVRWELGAGEVPLERLRARLGDHTLEFADGALVQVAPVGADLDAASLVVMEELAAAGVALRRVQRGMGLERRFIDDAAAAALTADRAS